MRIGVAQSRPVKGDIVSNIDHHIRLMDAALSAGAELVTFPELSATGYEPALARELAIHPDDRRFDLLQEISDNRRVSIGIGAPTRALAGTCISLILFQPGNARQQGWRIALPA